MDAIVARNREGHPPTVDYTEPARAPEPTSVTDAEAEANVMAVFGGDVKWVRSFYRHADHDGTTVFTDQDTGKVYKGAMPRLGQADGIPV